MSLEIRPATAADAEQIHRFIVALAIYEREPDAVQVSVAQLREQLAADKPPFECRLATWEGHPAGFCLFFSTYSTWRGPTLYLEDLFVDKSFRGKGIGRSLLLDLARTAVQRKCSRLDWLVLDWNQPAIQFYESIGAKKLNDFRVFRLADNALLHAGNTT